MEHAMFSSKTKTLKGVSTKLNKFFSKRAERLVENPTAEHRTTELLFKTLKNRNAIINYAPSPHMKLLVILNLFKINVLWHMITSQRHL